MRILVPFPTGFRWVSNANSYTLDLEWDSSFRQNGSPEEIAGERSARNAAAGFELRLGFMLRYAITLRIQPEAIEEYEQDPVNQRRQVFMGRLFKPAPDQQRGRALRDAERSLLP